MTGSASIPANYRKLALVISINAVVMFLLTYALIDSWGHFYWNINRIYMALLMVAPMVVLMLVVMRDMYPDPRLNVGVGAAFTLLFVAVFLLARSQTPVGDVQFLRSMIPHHSSAILMCEHGGFTDPEIADLCVEIVEAQKREIEEMREILARH